MLIALRTPPMKDLRKVFKKHIQTTAHSGFLAIRKSNLLRVYFLCAIGTTFSSCQGYRFIKSENPLLIHKIKSISVPMFVNLSIIPQVAGPFTQEIVKVLNQYSGLRVYPGESDSVDAVCIGIISSKEHRSQVYRPSGQIYIDQELAESIGTRHPYNLPINNDFDLDVRIMIIKNPNKSDISAIQSSAMIIDKLDKLNFTPEFINAINANPKTLVDYSFSLKGSFNRQIADTLSADSGGVVNFTKSKDSSERAVAALAQNAARNFQELVLNAY